MLGVNPLLAQLKNNGGPTETIGLMGGSPAIDAGSNALAVDPTTGLPLSTDQRGFTRIVNGTVDMGAFEVQNFVVYNTANSGRGSLRTAIINAEQVPGSSIFIATSGVITLLSPLPAINADVSIVGPGANVLSVSGNGTYEVFDVESGARRPPFRASP